MEAYLETVPKSLRGLRACLVCSIIKTADQFDTDGCDNCEEYLHLRHNREKVYACTSSSFDGMIALMVPQESWVAKWQRIRNCRPGCYAISVTGKLPITIKQDLARNSVAIRNRDTSVKMND